MAREDCLIPPLVLIAFAWVAGLVVADHLLEPSGDEPAVVAIRALIPAGGLFLWHRDRAIVLSACCGLAMLLGILRYQLALPDLDDPSFVANYNGSGWVTMEGVETKYPDVRDTWTHVTLDAEWIEAGCEPHDVSGAVLVRAPRFPEIHYDVANIAGCFLCSVIRSESHEMGNRSGGELLQPTGMPQRKAYLLARLCVIYSRVEFTSACS